MTLMKTYLPRALIRIIVFIAIFAMLGYICVQPLAGIDSYASDGSVKSPRQSKYPVMAENKAKAFMGFLFNEQKVLEQDLSKDLVFQFLTGKLTPYSREEEEGRQEFISLVDGVNGHIASSTKATNYLTQTLIDCLEKELGDLDSLDLTDGACQEAMDNIRKPLQKNLLETFTGVVVNGCGKKLTQATLDNLRMAMDVGSDVAALPSKIEAFVNRTVAGVSGVFLILNSEYEGRYQYFMSYLDLRKTTNDPNDMIFQLELDYNRLALQENTWWSGLTTLIPGKASWMECTDLIDSWAEDTYLIINGGTRATSGKEPQSITVQDAFTGTSDNAPFNINARAKTKLTYSSSDPDVASVAPDGTVTMKGAGTAIITITARANHSYEQETKTGVITVNKGSETEETTEETGEALSKDPSDNPTTESTLPTTGPDEESSTQTTGKVETSQSTVAPTNPIVPSSGTSAENATEPLDPSSEADAEGSTDPISSSSSSDQTSAENGTAADSVVPSGESSGQDSSIAAVESAGQPRMDPDTLEAVGNVVTDKGSKALYKITGTKAGKRTVAYQKPISKTASKVTIPGSVKIAGKSYRVTAIAANAFKHNKKLKSVKLSNNIEIIGKNAFKGCVKLKRVTIPKKTFKIGESAFAGCEALKRLTIKTKSLTGKNVGKNAFKSVSTKVIVDVPNAKIKAYKKLLKARGLNTRARIK